MAVRLRDTKAFVTHGRHADLAGESVLLQIKAWMRFIVGNDTHVIVIKKSLELLSNAEAKVVGIIPPLQQTPL